ncbi:hypothetical protein TruAng_008203 [Truncatella angustata]|nr:hypothetical protein TruAng_008203 [Truncatella angustata]
MGVRTAKPADLIMIDHNYLERLEIRQETLRNHAEKTLGCLPVGTAAVQEVYSYLLDSYLPVRYPLMFMKDEKKFFNRVTNTAFPLVPPADPVEALRLMAANVEDDMFILQQEPQGHRCIAAMCTSPSGFDPSQKLGKLLKDIHAPVPAYDKIGPSMEKYFSRVEVGKNAVRNNWSVTTTPDLFNVATNHIKEDDPIEEDINVDISKAILRCELQTLSRLPKTRALLFSFKTFTYPIEDIKAEGLGPQLADAIEGLKSVLCNGELATYGKIRSHNPRNNAPNSLPKNLNEVSDALYALNDLQLERAEPIHPLSLTHALQSVLRSVPESVQSRISIPNATLTDKLFGETSTDEFETVVAKNLRSEFWQKVRQKEYLFWPVYTGPIHWATIVMRLENSGKSAEFDVVTNYAVVDAERDSDINRVLSRVRDLFNRAGITFKPDTERHIWVPPQVTGSTWESGLRSFQLIRQLIYRVTDDFCSGSSFSDARFFDTPTNGWLNVDFVRHEMIGLALERCNDILGYSCRYALEPIQNIRLEGRGNCSPDCLEPQNDGKLAYIPGTKNAVVVPKPDEDIRDDTGLTVLEDISDEDTDGEPEATKPINGHDERVSTDGHKGVVKVIEKDRMRNSTERSAPPVLTNRDTNTTTTPNLYGMVSGVVSPKRYIDEAEPEGDEGDSGSKRAKSAE